jgi:hypothetical protein
MRKWPCWISILLLTGRSIGGPFLLVKGYQGILDIEQQGAVMRFKEGGFCLDARAFGDDSGYLQKQKPVSGVGGYA